MDFQTIMNTYLLPTGGLIIMGLISWGLKELQAYLKEKKAQAKSERKKWIFSMAMSATEEIAHQVEKAGDPKMSAESKESAFSNKVKEFAANEKVTVTEEEIDGMLKAVLGETRK
jgi:hypothetical protein